MVRKMAFEINVTHFVREKGSPRTYRFRRSSFWSSFKSLLRESTGVTFLECLISTYHGSKERSAYICTEPITHSDVPEIVYPDIQRAFLSTHSLNAARKPDINVRGSIAVTKGYFKSIASAIFYFLRIAHFSCARSVHCEQDDDG